VLTNKYAEGYPGARYYCGCEWIDVCERLAIERAKQLFGYDHANVQTHAGTQANMAVYLALLEAGDTILSMSFASGGHLSHGYKRNFSRQFYKCFNYGVNSETGLIDMDEVRRLAMEHKPRLIVAGASACASRHWTSAIHSRSTPACCAGSTSRSRTPTMCLRAPATS
jgi:glycine hydroxymethyltransferase